MLGRRLRVVAVVAAAVVLVGCNSWPQIGYGPEHQRHNTVEDHLTQANLATLTEKWSVEVPKVDQEPIVADGRVYVAGGLGVRALDEDDGTTVWEHEVHEIYRARLAPVARFGDVLSSSGYAIDNAGSSVFCGSFFDGLDPATGTTTPSSHAGSFSPPPVTSGSVVVQLEFVYSGSAFPPTCAPPRVVTLRARDKVTNAVLWQAEINNSVNYQDLESVPTIAHGRVYWSHLGSLYALALDGCGAATCLPIWSITPGDLHGTPVAGDEGQVFVATGDRLAAHAGDTGAQLWEADLPAAEFTSTSIPVLYPALADGVLYVAARDHNTGVSSLLAFDADGCGAATCAPLWTAELGTTAAKAPSAPVVAGGVLYVGTDAGVQAYDPAGCGAATCTPVLTIPVPGSATDLSVANGTLFVTTAHATDTALNRVTAFAPPG